MAAQAVVAFILMHAVGVKTTIVTTNGQASRRDLNVILTLDRSGSMASSKFCDPMKAAAQSFVDKFSNGRYTLGSITFMQSANVDYAPTAQKPVIKIDDPKALDAASLDAPAMRRR